MPITNATQLRKNLFTTLDEIIKNNEQLIVNTNNGNVVIISEDDFNGMKETIYILSQNNLSKKIKYGEKEKICKMKKFVSNEEW